MESFNQWTAALDQEYAVDIFYLDYQKAFDTVPHRRLIKMLNSYGVSGKPLLWISDLLHERKQKVVCQGTSSEWVPVRSGVPQGLVVIIIVCKLYSWSCIKPFVDDISYIIS